MLIGSSQLRLLATFRDPHGWGECSEPEGIGRCLLSCARDANPTIFNTVEYTGLLLLRTMGQPLVICEFRYERRPCPILTFTPTAS